MASGTPLAPDARGIHHVGLATHDMDATLEFYEEVLGFPARVCEMIEPKTGGAIRHAFLDIGGGELFAFMECNELEGVGDFDAGINRGLGIRGGMFHFAFKVDDDVALEKKRLELAEKGVDVTDVVDHGWCKSIYFKDPNFLQLEYCCLTEELGEEHTRGRESDAWTHWSRRRD
jgi:catechol 2,3-dioxygenase-like lactoylglutathione lyase family enzyme